MNKRFFDDHGTQYKKYHLAATWKEGLGIYAGSQEAGGGHTRDESQGICNMLSSADPKEGSPLLF